jgi:hypothetical protein
MSIAVIKIEHWVEQSKTARLTSGSLPKMLVVGVRWRLEVGGCGAEEESCGGTRDALG